MFQPFCRGIELGLQSEISQTFSLQSFTQVPDQRQIEIVLVAHYHDYQVWLLGGDACDIGLDCLSLAWVMLLHAFENWPHFVGKPPVERT